MDINQDLKDTFNEVVPSNDFVWKSLHFNGALIFQTLFQHQRELCSWSKESITS